MSNSSSSFTKEDENRTESEVSSRPTSEFHGGPIPTTASSNHDHHQNRESSDDEELRKPDDQTTDTAAAASSENPATNPCLDLVKTSNNYQQGVDINDDFTTPTSSDHKIPSPKHCPPAPRKPSNSVQPPPPPGHLRKRKGSPSSDIPFRDLDLFFIDQEHQGESTSTATNSHKVIKKPRTHHDHDNNED